MTSRRRRRTARVATGAARRDRPRIPLRAVLEHHAYSVVATLGRLARDPTGTLLTVAVIAIAIALPAALYLGLDNLRQVSAGWQTANEITVFLEPGADESAARETASVLGARADVAGVAPVAPETALADLEARGEFGEALAALEHNPLPWALVVTPAAGLTTAALERLAAEARALPRVTMAQFDMAWLIRFNSVVDVAQRLVQLIAALLTLGVLLIVGNTIRLDIENRREEIEITKMLGGTDGFVRRPFLYTGAWLGLAGGGVALLLILVALAILAPKVAELAAAYGSERGLTGPSPGEGFALVAGATAMGWVGAWVAVARHLGRIQPEHA